MKAVMLAAIVAVWGAIWALGGRSQPPKWNVATAYTVEIDRALCPDVTSAQRWLVFVTDAGRPVVAVDCSKRVWVHGADGWSIVPLEEK